MRTSGQMYTVLLALVVISACAPHQSAWDTIDYSRLARENQARENDPNYVQPSVVGCADDDLYNCK